MDWFFLRRHAGIGGSEVGSSTVCAGLKQRPKIMRASKPLGPWWRASLPLRGRRVHGTNLATITLVFIALGLTAAEPRDAQIRKGNGSGAAPSAPTTPPPLWSKPTWPQTASPQSRNQAVLQTIKATTGSTTTTAPVSTASQRQSPVASSSGGWLSRVPPWLWVVGGLLLLMMLARGR
jgi:hypothetical protein